MIIKGVATYVAVSTITFQEVKEEYTQPFHCISCGHIHVIIGGEVTHISPIAEPTHQLPVISICRTCKQKYIFQEQSYIPLDVIQVTLLPKEKKQSFYCYKGGEMYLNKMLEYDDKQIYSIQENKNMPKSFFQHCPNEHCTLTYQFTTYS